MAAPTREDFQALGSEIRTLTEVMQNAAERGGGGGDPDEFGPGGNFGGGAFSLRDVLNRISFQLPGGARAFQLGDTAADFQKLIKPVQGARANLIKFGGAVGAAAGAAVLMTSAFNAAARQLGGVTPGQALDQFIGNIGESIRGLARGRILFPGESMRIQGGFAREFGGLISPQAAALLQEAGQDLGLNVSQLVALERTLQGTGRESVATINQFRQVGVVGQVAAEELSKNATAVARAGGNFNSFIVEGIKNAKKLGLEFSSIEETLFGFSTDFEGTVESFARARALTPGFATNFSELFSVALTGSTDDLINIVRSDLLGAGITDISQLTRPALRGIEEATGFTGEQLQRILAGQEAALDTVESLDTTRNSLLTSILRVSTAILGVAGGSSIGGAIPFLGRFGAGIGGVLGGLAGFAAGPAVFGGMVDDAIIQNGRIIGTNPKDTIIATKTPGDVLGSTSVGSSALESKMDKLIMTMETQLNVFKNGLFVEMRDMDKAMIRQQEAAVRNF